MKIGLLARSAALGCAVLGAMLTGVARADDGLGRIKNIVVIYAENRSFDHLYGTFPGANGIADATPEQKTQLDHDGTALPYLITFGSDGKPDPKFPQMPNGPFRIDAPPLNRSLNELLPSPIHSFFRNQEQINGGKNNQFAAMSTVGGWTMGYFDGSPMRMWQWAKEYTLADNFFMGAFGGSYLNHQFLICACAPRHADAPEAMRIKLDQAGRLERKPGSPSGRDGAVELVTSEPRQARSHPMGFRSTRHSLPISRAVSRQRPTGIQTSPIRTAARAGARRCRPARTRQSAIRYQRRM
jgi:phospholipase C